MKKRLLILSDLWGRKKSEWLTYYIKELTNEFDIQYYDCCELGEIDISLYSEKNLHQQFINGGVDKAVQKLIQFEKSSVTILAYSIGGIIAWKYALKNTNAISIHCISSTRLRHEIIKPKCAITLYFGTKDTYIPKKDWFDRMVINPILVEGAHDIYTLPKFAKHVTAQILKKT